MTGARRWGEAARPAGRPPVDGRIRARVFALAVEHPDWGSRRIAREAGASRRSTQRWLAAEGVRGTGLDRDRVASYAAERAGPGVMGPAGDVVAWATSAVRPMTAADLAAMDREPGARVWVFP